MKAQNYEYWTRFGCVLCDYPCCHLEANGNSPPIGQCAEGALDSLTYPTLMTCKCIPPDTIVPYSPLASTLTLQFLGTCYCLIQ
jgi:hypothetical protein